MVVEGCVGPTLGSAKLTMLSSALLHATKMASLDQPLVADATPPSHAVCVTGLERSFPEFATNLVVSLEQLYGVESGGRLGWPSPR